MKKCPKCHADIEDNARFCVFCMSSLQEKQLTKAKVRGNKRWLYIIAALILFLLLITVICAIITKNKPNDKPSDSSSNLTASSIDGNLKTPVSTLQDDEKLPSKPENTDLDKEQSEGKNNGQDTIPNSNNNVTGNSNSNVGIDNDNNNNNNTNTTPDDSIGDSTITSPTPPTQTDTENDETIEESTPNTTPEDDVENDISIYEYRDAQKSDYTGYETDNAVVITKVVSPTSDGVYIIPNKINGKTVVAIMDNAFGGENVKNTVKTVVIPATIRTVWGNAFFSCHNLTDLYIKGDGFYVYDNFFPPLKRRNATITIHSSTICRDTKTSVKFSLIADYNDALFNEWNGEGF